MPSSVPVVSVLGATGRTGRLVIGGLQPEEVRLRLIGRSGSALTTLAADVGPGTETAVLAGIDADQVAGAIAGSDLVLNLAGPFTATAPVVANAAIGADASYIDIANERPAIAALYGLSALAVRAGVSLLPASGYGTVTTEGLAVWLAGGNAMRRVDLGLLPWTAGTSAGALESVLEGLATGAARVRNGQYERARLGSGAAPLTLPDGRRVTLVPGDLGDLATLPAGYGTPDVTASVGVALAPLLARTLLPAVSGVMRSTALRFRLSAAGGGGRRPPSRERSSYSWARVTLADGEVREGWLTAGEGYAFTADAVLAAVRRTLSGDALPGTSTAIRAFGPEFLEALPGVRLERVLPHLSGTPGRED
ncbi:saccharopine dehydrogenase NADP-binding domain-containing protein [Naasia aerilata]|nr:saccharopine dehydrogenase NADP-binding domain-containing protein [Naasia aerilata]